MKSLSLSLSLESVVCCGLRVLDNPREGWEDGTPPPHRDFKERSVVLAVAHPWASASSYLSSQFLAIL